MSLSQFEHLIGKEVNFHNGIDYTVFSIVDFTLKEPSIGIFVTYLYVTIKEPETEDIIPVVINDIGVVYLMNDDGAIEDEDPNGVGTFLKNFGSPTGEYDDIDY